ncbi:sporulation histidine kinase inhibitor Sda [Aquibacillus sediminis]|nr:sporulation histidine kinase inhibitor Sda [Aquibacillus sediminis]
MNDFNYLSNAQLIKSYEKAIEQNEETDFIMVFVRELKKRGVERIDV